MAPTIKRARKGTIEKETIESGSGAADLALPEATLEQQDNGGSSNDSEGGVSDSETDDNNSTDTETEIYRVRNTKSKKTLKRKHRATSPSIFGGTLEALLATSVPSNTQPGAPLALNPSIARKKNDEKLELKAKRVLETERKEKEEKGRVQDVIGGWDNQNERSLRKVAQRGVVHLFNAIQQAQSASAATLEENKKLRGSGKPTLPAPNPHEIAENKPGKKTKNKLLGKDASTGIDKNSFLDAIRSGGVVRQS
ncbi:Rrp15p protein [Rhizoctonia solani AG-3 Rhs1AP]|uniref:Rrp15p protein n=1 Tax=Rhizoctonia solani AG-3 Rhs1AP TaxID=1086054 RepID=X8JU21_9AGAM|nr:Rrp15p protein [Rhizoctonia solani AG-3 Rhs1AP]